MVGFSNVSFIVFIILCRRLITTLFLTYFLCALSPVFFEKIDLELNETQKSVVDILYKTYNSETVTRTQINNLVADKKISNPIIKHKKYLDAQLNTDEIIEFLSKVLTQLKNWSQLIRKKTNQIPVISRNPTHTKTAKMMKRNRQRKRLSSQN
mgnify:CR=1 FL=1